MAYFTTRVRERSKGVAPRLSRTLSLSLCKKKRQTQASPSRMRADPIAGRPATRRARALPELSARGPLIRACRVATRAFLRRRRRRRPPLLALLYLALLRTRDSAPIYLPVMSALLLTCPDYNRVWAVFAQFSFFGICAERGDAAYGTCIIINVHV